MDPEDSPELPPLKRGTYDLDAILAAAENAEFAVPPPPSKSSFNSNPFASSAPSGFRSTFNASNTPSINNSPYPTTSNNEQESSPSQITAKRPSVLTKKSTAPASAGSRTRVSTLKNTLSRFRKADAESSVSDNNSNDADDMDMNRDHAHDRTLSGDPAVSIDTDPAPQSFNGASPTPSNASIRSRNMARSVPFNRGVSPATGSSRLEPMTTLSPSRTSSPVNGSVLLTSDATAYSTPSNSRPSSRPTSRPSSRVSNGRYHSRQMSSESLASFNAMIDKDDFEEEQRNQSSGHVSFVVSDPEHLRILEGEIEDPFSPSMSSMDPDTESYLSSLMQQQQHHSPLGSRKVSSRGHSPAFKTRRQRAAEGDDSFLDSTDDGLSDKEIGSKFRTSRAGTRTPTSPLARALTRSSPRDHGDNMVVTALTNAAAQMSLDQILRDNSINMDSGSESFGDGPTAGQDSNLHDQDLDHPPATRASTGFSSPFHGDDRPKIDEAIKVILHSPVSHPVSPAIDGNDAQDLDNHQEQYGYHGHDHRAAGYDFDKQEPADVEVDIVVQNVSINDYPGGNYQDRNVPYSDDESDYDINDHELRSNLSGADVLANEEMQLHESVDVHESHAQSFAEWMSSSAEISRLDISPPLGSGQGYQSLAKTLAMAHAPDATQFNGTSLLSSDLGDANVLTSSFTPALSSPESNAGPSQSTSPTTLKHSTLLEKRSNLMNGILNKARGNMKSVDSDRSLTEKESSPPGSVAKDLDAAGESTLAPSVSFAGLDEMDKGEHSEEESQHTGDTSFLSATGSKTDGGKKEGGLVRRASGIMLSSRIRDSTNLDAPRYSIREMEDMKKNARMDLRIEITNEIREEYERSAEQEAAIYQFEIEELKNALESEKNEKQQLKSVLDEFESSLADIAVSTSTEIQSMKDENKKLTESKQETEEAFVQLKIRYDELRDLNVKHVENENILRKAVETLKQDFETSEARYEGVKTHADARLVVASQEMEQARMMWQNEMAQLRAQMQQQEMHMRSLEQALETKNKENEDLILFSEELISKLG
ncbi:Transforming acidic coiled-coil-containing protein 2 [Gryganskiella cystojenkinii]|nr:Transforming acidic coiled-coil-containing protein 2 [Gryganskiella cystojenkinii]